MSRSIKKFNSNSLIDLSLPDETERYYFKIVATKIIVSQADKFGFSLASHEYFPSHEKTELEFTISENQMTLEEIASVFDMSIVALKEFNPQLRDTFLPRGTYQLKVPVESYLKYKENEEGKNLNNIFSLGNPDHPNVDDINSSKLPKSK